MSSVADAGPASPSPPHTSPLLPAFAPTALALLLGLQPLAADLYLPASPVLAQELARPVAQVLQTMSALILAFGLSEKVWWPAAERFGRRPVLIAGLARFVAAMLGAAPGIGWVTAWRAGCRWPRWPSPACSRSGRWWGR